MADGRWVMTEDELNSVVCGFAAQSSDIRSLPNYGKKEYIDNREGGAALVCAFCGSEDLSSGFGGCGDGFGYRSSRCRTCGAETAFVYNDDAHKFFK